MSSNRNRSRVLPMAALKRALGRGADPRYLTLFVVGMLAPGALAFAPSLGFLGSLFDTSTRSRELVAWLDSPGLVEVLRQLGQPEGESVTWGLAGAGLVAALIAPLLAGAAVVVARGTRGTQGTDVGSFRSLLAGAAALYGRMIRMAVASCIPFGIAAAGVAGANHLARSATDRAVTEASADTAGHAALFVSIALVWLAGTLVEAGRAHFAIDPQRRSALVSLASGGKLFVRRPLAVLEASLVPTLAGVVIAAVITAIRMRIPQAGAASIGFAFVLSQVVVSAMAWGRASRLVGLAEVLRTERADAGTTTAAALPSSTTAA
jgi:hypothetical protein